MRFIASSLLLVIAAASIVCAQEKPPANWDAPLCKPVDREAVHEFTRAPTVRKVGSDRYEIAFACKGKGDVAVAIEDASGRIVKHLVYGVLGANAPAPFKEDSLEQTIYWDGKDEFGKYVRRPESCRVRVSLGLNPTFDRLVGWHPKDTASSRIIGAIAADADGVYVLECRGDAASQVRKYDHDGNYVETLVPWNPEKLDQIVMPKRTLPDAKIWPDGQTPDSRKVAPVLVNYGSTDPFGYVQTLTCMAAVAGKIACFTKGGPHDIRRLIRLRTDGTSGGERVEGARLADKPNSYAGQAHITLSPDGKWVYVTGMSRVPPEWRDGLALPHYREAPPPYVWNAVHRFAWDAQGVVVEGKDSFIGEVSRDAKKAGADDDNDHLTAPRVLACDADVRLYVADFRNNRIQIFSPEGKYLKTIPVEKPQEIAVHQKTGEIYVLCFRRTGHGVYREPIMLVKFGPFADPKRRLAQSFPVEGDEFVGSIKVTPVMAVDSWASEPRLWLVHKQGVVRIYADNGQELTLIGDFEDDVRRAGHTPHSTTVSYMDYLAADPLRGHLYRGRRDLRRIDPEEGKTWEKIETRQMPKAAFGDVEETVFGWDGLMHVRSLQYIARFNPDKFAEPIVLNADCELPFDYGNEKGAIDRRGERVPQLHGVISMPWAIGGPNGYNNGVGISPKGDVVVLIENVQDFEIYRKPRASNPAGWFESGTLKRLLALNEKGFRPSQFPGRSWSHGHLVWRFSSSGQPLSVDVLPGLSRSSFGIRTDSQGNIFCGVGYHRNVDGKEHIGGSLAKFAPKGGRLIRDFNTAVKLDKPPQRPADFLAGSGKIWGQNMYWAAAGMDQLNLAGGEPSGTRYPCECYHCKFDTDLYGRSFMPRAYGYHVAILDTNGNRICEVGRYGNADSPAMKPGDTDIGLGQCSYLATVSDQWLYIADDSNTRIIRVKLGYREQKIVSIGSATK